MTKILTEDDLPFESRVSDDLEIIADALKKIPDEWYVEAVLPPDHQPVEGAYERNEGTPVPIAWTLALDSISLRLSITDKKIELQRDYMLALIPQDIVNKILYKSAEKLVQGRAMRALQDSTRALSYRVPGARHV